MGTVAENLRRVNDQIAQAVREIGRDPDGITLVAVSKRMPVAAINEAVAAGHRVFGESRVVEAKGKIPQVAGTLEWHMIGHLQTNKVRDAVALFDLIHSVDSLRLAEEINRRAGQSGKVQNVLVQVNTTGETQKSGCAPEEVDTLVGQIAELSNVRVQGLMTIGPFVDDSAVIRRAFQLLRRAYERLRGTAEGRVHMKYLSMGMSGDFTLALAEGANMLRIGTAIFGPRP